MMRVRGKFWLSASNFGRASGLVLGVLPGLLLGSIAFAQPVAPADRQSITMRSAADEWRTHGPVRRGETIWAIAEQYAPVVGNRPLRYRATAAIARANPQIFSQGVRALQVGAVLRIPPPELMLLADEALGRALMRGEAKTLPPLTLPVDTASARGPVLRPEPSQISPRTSVNGRRVPPLRPSVSFSQNAILAAATSPASPTTPAAPPRRRPGARTDDDPVRFDPNRATGLEPVPPPDFSDPARVPGDTIAVPDRWRLLSSLGLIDDNWWDPYNQNTLKADRPLRGLFGSDDWFLNTSAIADLVIEPRRAPTPVGPQTTNDAGDIDVFGGGVQTVYAGTLLFPWVLYKGNTTFKPPDWEYRLTPAFQYNYVELEERRALRVDPREGITRNDSFFAIQEAFVDKHLRNVSDRYDFDSLRVGIQPFSSDFRGFLFQDLQLGIRLFGNRDNNKYQYNLAWFRRLEKDTNSGLNDIGEEPRADDVFLANLYRQDWPFLGYFSQVTAIYNRNREGDRANFFDNNGFIARPASLGGERPRNYDVGYLGYNGDGHIGRLNLTVSAYLAFGEEDTGTFRQEGRDILAGFYAAELSRDYDWIRLRGQVLYATADDDPFDDEANGFDAIFENPIFAGSDTSYWIRQTVPLIAGGGVVLSTRNGLLNSLRHSKEHGQSNFANPGTTLVGVGADFDFTPQFRLSFNFNQLGFVSTETLEVARNQPNIGKLIGYDLSAAAIWRPLMTQNIVVRLSGAGLIPGDGFEDLFPGEDSYSILANIVLTY